MSEHWISPANRPAYERSQRHMAFEAIMQCIDDLELSLTGGLALLNELNPQAVSIYLPTVYQTSVIKKLERDIDLTQEKRENAEPDGDA